MIEVDPHSPQGVYDTLLELRLQDWAHEQDSAVSSAHTSTLILMPCDAMKIIDLNTACCVPGQHLISSCRPSKTGLALVET